MAETFRSETERTPPGLLVFELVGAARTHLLDARVCRVGTNSRLELGLAPGSGAPFHAVLIPRGTYVEVRPTGAAGGGVQINGEVVLDSAILRPGSTIRFGEGEIFDCKVALQASN